MAAPLSVCFVALNSFSLFRRSSEVSHIGGAEAQQYEIACYLRDQGHRVTFIVKDHGQPARMEHEGITVLSAYQQDAGLPVLRFFHPRWSGLAAAMQAADAQIYYQRSSGAETGQVALWCARHKRRFVYGVASGGDCMAALPAINRAMDRQLFRIGLRRADCIVAQTDTQKSLLRSDFDLDSVVIPNVIRRPEASPESGDQQTKRVPKSVLWVGRVAPVKRVEWILEIATAQPDYQFRLVCGLNHKTDYAVRLVEQLEQLSNVTLIDSMSRPELFVEYQKASVLLLTSRMEGFPNVFIEAWLAGTPVLSTFDPDQLVLNNRLGWIEDTQAALIARLAGGLFESQEQEAGMRDRVLRYAQEHHAPEVLLPRFETMLRSLL
ncbi:MAG: glycosyltransferase family 4 protein [Pseudomonadales bacterium]